MKKYLLPLIALLSVVLFNDANAAGTATTGAPSLTFLKDIVDGIDTTTIYAALTSIFTLMAGIAVFSKSAHWILGALGRK